MAFNFRKSFKILPGVRLNLSKRGMGVSFGGKGFRHTVGASGRRTTTVGIPGTGVSYSKTSTKSRSKRKASSTPRVRNSVNNLEGSTLPNRKVKKPFYKSAGFIAIATFVILGGIGLIYGGVNSTDSTAEPVDASASLVASESAPSSSVAAIERVESILSSSSASLPPDSSAVPVLESSQESESSVSSEESKEDATESSESSVQSASESSVASESSPKSTSKEETSATQEIAVKGALSFSRNEDATVSIVGLPNTQYSIAVYYSSGKSTAKGLEPKTSNASGGVSWTWKIGGKTNPGTYRATITGGGETKEIAFTVS